MAEIRYLTEEDRNEFFSKCDVVVRAPGWYFWAGEISNKFCQPALTHQLNLWAYVGIEFKKSGPFEITLKHIRKDAQFLTQLTSKLTTDYREKGEIRPGLIGQIKNAVELLGSWKRDTKYTQSFNLYIWSDIPIAVGLNSSAAISSCVGMLLFIAKRTKQGERVNHEYYNKVFSDLFAKSCEALLKKPEFLEIYHTAWYFDNNMHGIFKSGVGPLASLIRPHGGKQLFLYMLLLNNTSLDKDFFNCPRSFKVHLRRVSQTSYIAQRLALPRALWRDVGFSLFFSGSFEEIRDGIDGIIDKQSIDKQAVANVFTRLASKFDFEQNSFSDPLGTICRLAQNSAGDDQYTSCSIYARALGFVTLKIIDCLLAKKFDRDDFYNLIKENHLLIKAYTNIEGTAIGYAKKEILDYSNVDDGGRKAYIKSVGAGAGGDLLCFAHHDPLRDHINQPYGDAEINGRHFKSKVRLHYTSDIDGWTRGKDTPPVFKAKIINGSNHSFVFKFSDKGIVEYQNREMDLDETNFAIFLYLAAARKYGKNGGYLHKGMDLQTTGSNNNQYFQLKLKVDEFLKLEMSLFKSSGKKDHKVYFDVMPEDIKFDNSLVLYKSSHYDNLHNLVYRANKFAAKNSGLIKNLLTNDFMKNFKSNYLPFRRNTQLILNAAKFHKHQPRQREKFEELLDSSMKLLHKIRSEKQSDFLAEE
ncbi:MAG: hypothetical protein R3F48_06810 [Candidatus Zixiibacteriota bacterium]